jgi:hypothetical protein
VSVKKIFSNKDTVLITVILVVCAVAGNLFLDNINRGNTTISVNECANIQQSFFQDIGKFCKTSEKPARQYGWPLIVKKTEAYGSRTATSHQYSIASARSGSHISLNSLLLMLFGAALYAVLKPRVSTILIRGRPQESPIISTSDFFNEPGLTSIYRGDFSGYKLNLLTNKTGRVMLNVSLHRNTNFHLLAFGARAKTSLPLSSGNSHGLQEIVLEGDFPSHFQIYCKPGYQNQTLQILEPVTMQYLATFCKSYDLEIFNDVLYVTKAQGAEDEADSTTIVEDTKKLLEYHGKKFDRLNRQNI